MPLVNTKKMFEEAMKGGFAVGAFNVNNMELLQGIIKVTRLTKNFVTITYYGISSYKDLIIFYPLPCKISFLSCKECRGFFPAKILRKSFNKRIVYLLKIEPKILKQLLTPG